MAHLKILRIAAASALVATAAAEKPPGIVRIDHETREIEGWAVHVDASLLTGAHQATGDLALRVLGERLHQIVLRLPAAAVAKMKEVPIYLDRDHPLGNAHYHPDADWLERHGYDPAMGKAVQFTRAESLIREASRPDSSSVVLHELAHAYHDRVLGFDHPGILDGYKVFCDSRKFDRVPHVSGPLRPHYGLTDHKEFFAEMTETFFVGNDYWPFSHRMLYDEHRPSYDLLASVWETDIKPPAPADSGEPGILELRILSTLMAQRGDFEGAFALLDKAEKRDADREGRLANLRKHIEELRAGGTAHEDTP